MHKQQSRIEIAPNRELDLLDDFCAYGAIDPSLWDVSAVVMIPVAEIVPRMTFM
jgi:hypothetical protein